MTINSPEFDLIKLEKARHAPSISFHTGSLYFTVRSSTVLDLQAGESRKLSLKLNADCDVMYTQDTSQTSSFKESYPEVPCNSISSAMPFHEDPRNATHCERKVRVEFQEGYIDSLNAASRIEKLAFASSCSGSAEHVDIRTANARLCANNRLCAKDKGCVPTTGCVPKKS